MNGRHTVRTKNPDIRSHAALVLLTRAYEKKRLQRWLDFRDVLLDAAEARDGCLKCHYCGRADLVREVPDYVRKPKNLATIDHVLPRSKGGQDDDDNCVIACFTCNQRKGDNTGGEWNEDSN